jgi:hypothetical protein
LNKLNVNLRSLGLQNEPAMSCIQICLSQATRKMSITIYRGIYNYLIWSIHLVNLVWLAKRLTHDYGIKLVNEAHKHWTSSEDYFHRSQRLISTYNSWQCWLLEQIVLILIVFNNIKNESCVGFRLIIEFTLEVYIIQDVLQATLLHVNKSTTDCCSSF